MARKKRILIIDDETMFTRLLKLNLEKTGEYEARDEKLGARGFPAALEFKPDLILLDVVMPDIDGGTVASQLRADPQTKDIPILFLTAVMSREETRSTGRLLSGYPCVAKPATGGEILARIEELLEEKGPAER